MRLMDHEGVLQGPVNLGNPVELTVGDLAKRVVAMVRSSSRLVLKPLPVDDPRRRRPDITRATQLLGWTPRTSLDVGLKNTIAWFANQREPGGVNSQRTTGMREITRSVA